MIKLIPSLEMLEDILRTIRIQDVLDILIVAYLVYKLIDLLRETRAGQLIKGVLGIILVYVLSQAFQLRAVSAIIRYLITYGVFALLIIFQPELRKILEKLGRTSFSLTQIRKTVNSIGGNSFENNSNMMSCINAICDSQTHTLRHTGGNKIHHLSFLSLRILCFIWQMFDILFLS